MSKTKKVDKPTVVAAKKASVPAQKAKPAATKKPEVKKAVPAKPVAKPVAAKPAVKATIKPAAKPVLKAAVAKAPKITNRDLKEVSGARKELAKAGKDFRTAVSAAAKAPTKVNVQKAAAAAGKQDVAIKKADAVLATSTAKLKAVQKADKVKATVVAPKAKSVKAAKKPDAKPQTTKIKNSSVSGSHAKPTQTTGKAKSEKDDKQPLTRARRSLNNQARAIADA